MRRWSQGLQDWSTGAPPEHQAAQLCCAGDRAVAQAAQSLWALLGDLQTPAGHGAGHPALGVPAGAGAGPDGPRGPFQPQPRGASVLYSSFPPSFASSCESA